MVTELLEEIAALEWEFEYPVRMGFVQYKDCINEEQKKEKTRKRAALIVELLIRKGIIEG